MVECCQEALLGSSSASGIRGLLSTVFGDETLLDFLSQALYDTCVVPDTEVAWELLEPFLIDAGVPEPSRRAIRLQLGLMLPSPDDAADDGCEPELLEKAVVLSDLIAPSATSTQTAQTPCEDVREGEKASLLFQRFEDLRKSFFKKYEQLIRENISSCFQGELEILSAPVSSVVMKLFVDGSRRNSVAGKRTDRQASGRWIPVLHGTTAENHRSIFEQGLLIPGRGNSLRVVHGAAHGRGIYTAGLHAAWLSKGFCSEHRMLVCAVLRAGDYKYARDAIVVMDKSHVVPLFEAIWDEANKESQ